LDLHESGTIEWALKRTSTTILVFIFDLEYFMRVRSSEPLHAKMNPMNACLDHFVLKQRSFPPNHALKMQERHQLFVGLRLVSKEFLHPAIQIKIEQHFGRFFHQIKVRQPIGRQDSMQTVIRTNRRLDSFLHEAAQNFEVFSNILE
jgi:hypothetical protein